MVSTLLLRGMIVGLLAGLLVFALGRYVGEAQVDRAISFETSLNEHADDAKEPHMEHEAELVSRFVQASWGLFTGVMVYSTALGGLFALAFAAIHQRAVNLGPRATSALLAAAGFVSVYLVPGLKYPANPPAVGEPETLGYRTALYFGMLAFSVIAIVLAAMLRKRLAVRYDGWTAAYAAVGFYIATMILTAALLPAINEVPDAFPAAVLWHFRIASFGMQLVMWATFGLAFGALTERAWAKERAPRGTAPNFMTARS